MKAKMEIRTRNESRKLIRNRACIRYSGTVKDVMLNLLDGTYSPKQEHAEGHTVTRRFARLMRGLPIELRQFERILKQLETDGILQDYKRESGNVTYRLDLTSLEALEGIDPREIRKARNADRALKAREQRALNREKAQYDRAQAALLSLAPRFIDHALNGFNDGGGSLPVPA